MIALTPPPQIPLPPPPASLNELTNSGRTLKRGILHVQVVHNNGRNDGEFLAVLSAAHSALYLFAADAADTSDALDKDSNNRSVESAREICTGNEADPLFVLGLDPSSTISVVSKTDTFVDTVLETEGALHSLATDIVVKITTGVAQWKLFGRQPRVLNDWRACIKSVIELSVAQTQIKFQHSSQQILQLSQSHPINLNLKQSAGSVHVSRSVPILMQPRMPPLKPPSLVLKSPVFSGVSSRPMGEIRVASALSPRPLSADTNLTRMRSASANPALTKSYRSSSLDPTAPFNFSQLSASLQVIPSNTSHKIIKTKDSSFGPPSLADNITISTPQLMSISSESGVFREDSLSATLNTTHSLSSSSSSSVTFGTIPYQGLFASTSVSASAGVASTTSGNNLFRSSSSSPSSSSSAKSEPEKYSRSFRETPSRSPSFSQGGQTLSKMLSKIGWSKKTKSEKELPSTWKSSVAMRRSRSMGGATEKL
ncbi:hypothetical protein HK100_006995 [Physocladia obscura]|uniref:Uncharacterized protein n=1 Tax=Physocladia obscura TaxID=109957 RepID=A0AAD5SPS3_9FUNG|nr:hypothetical protein HK100_006995 [Physocladia obscura]